MEGDTGEATAKREVRHPLLWRGLANGSTLANGLCGIGAIIYVMLGNKLFALALIFIGIGWDGLDGLFSRRSGVPPRLFGRVADSVADAITFAIAPAVVIYFDNYPTAIWSPYQTLVTGVALLVGALALVRLLYFTLEAHSLPFFLGASTPQNAMALIFLVLLLENPGFLGLLPLEFLLLAAVFASWMVVPVPYPKMRSHKVLRWLTIALTVVTVFAIAVPNFRPLLGTPPYTISYVLAVAGFVLLVSFYVAGPFLVKREGDRSSSKENVANHEN